MKSAVLLFTVTVVSLALVACAQQKEGVAPLTSLVCTSGTLKDVPFLLLPFDPPSNLNQNPQPDSSVPINPDVQLDLTAAFNSAAPAFRQQLCGLDGIFIDPSNCRRPDSSSPYDPNTCNLTDNDVANHSWGLRVISSGKRYVTLSLGLWNNSSSQWSCQSPHKGQVCAPPLLAYQTKLIQALLKTVWPNASSNLPQFVSVSPATANTSAMSVLAILAHEYGHVLWYDTFVPNLGGDAETTVPISGFCNGQLFYSQSAPYSWPYTVDVPSGRWLKFGEIRNQAYPSEVLQLPGLLVQKHPSEGGDRLHAIFTNPRWASALAAFSPDEDFVETFELSVLTYANPPLTSLIISTQGTRSSPYQDDILNNVYAGSELGRKYQCFAAIPTSFLRR